MGEFHNSRTQVFLVQHLAAFLVDDFTLLVHNIVVFQDHLTDIEVPFFHPLLGIFNGTGHHLVFNRFILFQSQLIHHVLDPVAAKEAHQVIFQRQVEP